jgi:hypothetical protein
LHTARWPVRGRRHRLGRLGRQDDGEEFAFEDELKALGVPFDRENSIELDQPLNPYHLLSFRPRVGEMSGTFDGDGYAELTVGAVGEIIEDPSLDPVSMLERLADLEGVKMEGFLEQYPLPSLEIVEDEAPVPVAP